ncbi:MAG: hypothetical protein JWP91_2025 [Fibrobacteres bacterium]|nr:hypothetical protein [Fibrobacterota bacterium]
MLNIAVLLFALSAAGGLLLASMHFRGKDRPWILSILHGLLAASGLVILLVAVKAGGTPEHAKLALILFIVAALGGFLLFAFHLQKKKLPSAVVVIHAGVAVSAFLLLAASLYLGK